jgi:hypothetical protein
MPFNSIGSPISLRFFSWGKPSVSSNPRPILLHRSYVQEGKFGAVMAQVWGHRSARLGTRGADGHWQPVGEAMVAGRVIERGR